VRAEVTTLVADLETKFAGEEPLPPVADCLPDGVTESEKKLLLTFCGDGIVGPDDVIQNDIRTFDKRFGALGWSPPAVWQERFRQLSALAFHQKKLPQTVEFQVERFLAFKETQVRGGVLKPRTWGTLKERLPVFVNWIKPGTHVATINGTTITEFYKWLWLQPPVLVNLHSLGWRTGVSCRGTISAVPFGFDRRGTPPSHR
jgi:hypothetical protein